MKTNVSRIFLLIAILAFALYGCSSTPEPEQTDGIAGAFKPVSALTGTWKLTNADSSSQVLQFQADGTGSRSVVDASGRVTETSQASYALGDDTRFRIIGDHWVWYVPCEVRGSELILSNTGEIFKKQ